MVEVEKFIKKLLYEHDCLIVPGLGGLLIHKLEPAYSAEKASYLPGYRTVKFNEVLSMDDGVLAHAIAAREGVKRAKANKYIQDYVNTIRSHIRKNRSVVLSGIGELRPNDEGKLIFQPLGASFSYDFYGMAPIPATPISIQDSEVVESNSLTTQVDEGSPSKWYEGNWIGWLSAAAVVIAVAFLSLTATKTTGRTDLSSIIPPLPVNIMSNILRSSIKPGNVKATFPITAKEKTSALDAENPKRAATPVIKKFDTSPDSLFSDVAFNYRINRSKSPKKYYTVVGVYDSQEARKNPKYIDKIEQKLWQNGFPNAEVIERKGQVFVVAGNYWTKKSALRALTPLKNQISEKSWVYRDR